MGFLPLVARSGMFDVCVCVCMCYMQVESELEEGSEEGEVEGEGGEGLSRASCGEEGDGGEEGVCGVASILNLTHHRVRADIGENVTLPFSPSPPLSLSPPSPTRLCSP